MSLEDRVRELEDRLDYLTDLLGQFAGNSSGSNYVSTGAPKSYSSIQSRPNIKRNDSRANMRESTRNVPMSLAALAGNLLDEVGMDIKQL